MKWIIVVIIIIIGVIGALISKAYYPNNDISTVFPPLPFPPPYGKTDSTLGSMKAQRKYYPAVKPLYLQSIEPKENAENIIEKAIKKVVNEFSWDVKSIDNNNNEDTSMYSFRLHAVVTTPLRFNDDVVIYVSKENEEHHDSKEEGGFVVNMRSKSRLGKSDIGVNARRIGDFFVTLENELFPQKAKDDKELAIHHWIWQHQWQQYDLNLFSELLDQVDSLKPEILKKAWELIYNGNLEPHTQVEDLIFFPAMLKRVTSESEREAMEILEEQHPQLQKQQDDISQLVEKASNMKEKEESFKEIVKEISKHVKVFSEAYNNHTAREEAIIKPIARKYLTREEQKAIGKEIQEYIKKTGYGYYTLIQFRDSSSRSFRTQHQYENAFPWIMKKLIIPAISLKDGYYKAYNRVFKSVM